MRKTIKLMSGVLALAMCFSAMPTAVFAEQVEDQTLTANDTASVEVVISTASQYEVKIPKKLTLSVPATQNAEMPYTYMVKGSIAGNEQVKVVPDATVTMMQEGKEDNVGDITQEKQIWSCADFEALNGSNAAEIVWSEATPGNILVENMSAGVWNGTFNFNIALEVDTLPPDTDTMIYRVENLDPSIQYSEYYLDKETMASLCGGTLPSDIVMPVAYMGEYGWNKVAAAYGWNACNDITSVTIPITVTRIESNAFYSCENLTSVIIPNSVTSISAGAFKDCHNLTSITYNGTIEQWNNIEKALELGDTPWDENSGNYTIHCTDGHIYKTGSIDNEVGNLIGTYTQDSIPCPGESCTVVSPNA